MSSPSRDHLLGYLLQALAPDEHDQIEAELDHSPALRAEMRRLEANLKRVGLGEQHDYFDPPAGLAERTCDFVTGHAAQPVVSPAGVLAYHPGAGSGITPPDYC